ncbi:hypothetical protein F4809DRAFT_351479 [Biscogniauxia mediterranea]|nr:hypothetical protein F4809DRAFT_351479 [Biscogniauxia mediterranea]
MLVLPSQLVLVAQLARALVSYENDSILRLGYPKVVSSSLTQDNHLFFINFCCCRCCLPTANAVNVPSFPALALQLSFILRLRLADAIFRYTDVHYLVCVGNSVNYVRQALGTKVILIISFAYWGRNNPQEIASDKLAGTVVILPTW